MNALMAAELDVPALAEEPVDAWTLDELGRDADLETLQWALERTDQAGS